MHVLCSYMQLCTHTCTLLSDHVTSKEGSRDLKGRSCDFKGKVMLSKCCVYIQVAGHLQDESKGQELWN